MGRPEAAFRSRIVKLLKPLHAMPVENPVWPGSPDISYAGGWIELKIEKWTRRNGELVLPLDHLTPQQKLWMYLRWQAICKYRLSEALHLMVATEDEIFVLHGTNVHSCQEKDRRWWQQASWVIQRSEADKKILQFFSIVGHQ